MQIIWHGQSCFKISVKSEQIAADKKEEVAIIIDPFEEKVGFKPPRLKADIVAITHDHFDHNNVKAVEGEPFLIDGPGEYERKGVKIWGIEAFHDEQKGAKRGLVTIYIIEAEGLRVCHLGDFGQSELSSAQLEEIGDIDILMVPVGGVYTIGAKEAAETVNQIEPKIVIPMHYKIPKLEIKLDSADKFLEILGAKSKQAVDKLTVKKKDLPQEGTEVIVMKA